MISVLVVEDDPVAVEAHLEYLARLPGFVVAGHVRNGTDALSRLVQESIDLMLLDIFLPDMNGLDVLRRMRAAGIATDVIAVTRARDLDVVRASVSYGVVQYLIKPFTFSSFRRKLELYVSYHQTSSNREQFIVQRDVDDLLSALREPDSHTMPPAIAQESLRAVVKALRGTPHDSGLSAVEAARSLGASR